MVRSTVEKVMWVGRATVFLVGLSVILAVIFGVASTAAAHGGYKGLLHLGHSKTAKAVTTLVGQVATGEALVVKNPSGGEALGLSVGDPTADPAIKTVAPMKVDSQAKVANLNADQIDGKDESAFLGKTEKAQDSDKLDGVDSTGFYAAGSKVADSDKLDGKDFSAFGAAQVIDGSGRLPVQGTYTSKGGTLIISASGSGYRETTPGLIGMYVMVDLTFYGRAAVYTNEKMSHKAFVDDYTVVSGLPAGQHTIRLMEAYDQACGTPSETDKHVCTRTDDNDRFQVTVLEIPN